VKCKSEVCLNLCCSELCLAMGSEHSGFAEYRLELLTVNKSLNSGLLRPPYLRTVRKTVLVRAIERWCTPGEVIVVRVIRIV